MPIVTKHTVVEGTLITIHPKVLPTPLRPDGRGPHHGETRSQQGAYSIQAQVVFSRYHDQDTESAGVVEKSAGYFVVSASDLVALGISPQIGDMLRNLGGLSEKYYILNKGEPFGDFIGAETGFAFRAYTFSDRKPVS